MYGYITGTLNVWIHYRHIECMGTLKAHWIYGYITGTLDVWIHYRHIGCMDTLQAH